MFNCGLAPMDDVRNRQGVMYALDYDKICKVGMSDLATPATSFVQKEHASYNPAKVQYPGQMDKAKELLAETGLKNVRLLASDHGWFAAVRPMIKESLEAAGLTVNYEEKKSADVYATIDGDPSAYDVVIAPGDPSVFGDDADLLLRWWYAADTWTDTRMHWKGQDSYKKVQELLDTAAKATGDEQKKAWYEIYDVVSENRSAVPDLPPQVADRLRRPDPPGLQADRRHRPVVHRRRLDEVVDHVRLGGHGRRILTPWGRATPRRPASLSHRPSPISARESLSVTNLLRLLGRRLVALPIMVLGVTLLVFVVMSFSSADPARLALGESASPEALDAYREANGLNDPLLVRYVRYIGGLVQGDLGESFTGVPVSEMVAHNFPITLQLTFVGLVIAVVLALVLGVIAALYRDRWPDQVIRVISIASLATPVVLARAAADPGLRQRPRRHLHIPGSRHRLDPLQRRSGGLGQPDLPAGLRGAVPAERLS